MHKLNVVAVLLLASGGCKVQTGINSGAGPGGAISGGDSSGGGGGEASAAGDTCADPQNHCLEPDDVMIGESDFTQGYINVNAAKAQSQPNSNGEVTFMKLGDGANQTTKYFWKTHPMTDDEIKVGALMIALDFQDGGMYRGPKSRQQATTTNWFLARIVNVDGLAQGEVQVSGGYKVSREALRAVEGDTSPRLTTTGPEDKFYVKPDYWLVSTSKLPESGYISADLALPVKAPSPQTGGEGQFLKLGSGELVWTKYAWRQRLATPADMKVGSFVIALDFQEGSVYTPPTSREKALNTNWFIAKITDAGQAYKGVVTLAGQYPTKIDGARVIAK